MEIYTDKGCKCKDSDPICEDMEYIVVHEKSIKKIKEIHFEELNQLKIFGKIILGQNVSHTTINNWAKVKHYHQKHTSDLKTDSFAVAKAKSILNCFNNPSKVGDDLKCGKELLMLSHSLHKLGAKTLLFDAGCADSKRILIASGGLSIFEDMRVNSNTKTKFIKLLQDVFHEMGEKYNPVHITSGYRTYADQARIMCDMLDWSTNMYHYYDHGYDATPYIKIVQNLYDGEINEDEINKNPKYTDIITSLIPKEHTSYPLDLSYGDNIAINMKVYGRQLVKSTFYKNRMICQHLLTLGMHNSMGNPSHHTTGQAFDIELNYIAEYISKKFLNNKGITRNSNNPHLHITLI
ncbi:MAG: hypothetical protein ACRCVW_03175 [Brevinema sp.]